MMRTLLLAILLTATGCAAPDPSVAAHGLELFVLGVGQDGGMPHLGCDRACCTEARASGRQVHPVSLGVHDADSGQLLLLEATPAIEAQVALLQQLAGPQHSGPQHSGPHVSGPPFSGPRGGRGRTPVDGILLTHAHIGHYLGLAQLGREVAGTRALPVWVSPRFASFLRGHGPWRQLVELGQIELREFALGVPFEPLPGLSVTALAVPHRDEFSDTVAYQLRGPRATVLFVPDVDRWERAGSDLLAELFDGVDVAYVDGTFYDGRELPDRDPAEIPHPPMVDTVARLGAAVRARPGSIRFIHLNHTNPALRDRAVQRELERRGFRLARRGERVEL